MAIKALTKARTHAHTQLHAIRTPRLAQRLGRRGLAAALTAGVAARLALRVAAAHTPRPASLVCRLAQDFGPSAAPPFLMPDTLLPERPVDAAHEVASLRFQDALLLALRVVAQ